MAWLAIHMWLLLLGALLLGLLLGWWIWHRERIVERVVESRAPDPISPGAVASPTTVHGASTKPMAAATIPASKPANVGIAPVLYSSATEGPEDDLKKIKGIGPNLEELLQSLGIFYFRQIADWNRDHVAWVDQRLQFPGRIDRENWIEQAKILRQGGETEFAKRYDKGETPSSYKKGDGPNDTGSVD